MTTPDDDDDDRAFTPQERREIRRIVDAQQRAEWFWKSARVWAAWVSAAVIGGYAMAEVLEKIARRVVP